MKATLSPLTQVSESFASTVRHTVHTTTKPTVACGRLGCNEWEKKQFIKFKRKNCDFQYVVCYMLVMTQHINS